MQSICYFKISFDGDIYFCN